MTRNRLPLWTTAALWPMISSCSAAEPSSRPEWYHGMCDASAAVALDGSTFIAADDEQNTLRVYRCDRGGAPLQAIPWDAQLGIDPRRDEHPEVDIEGATVLGGRVWWISSHGRNRKGKWRPNRHRLFAMTVHITPSGVVAEPFAAPYEDLAMRLVADRRMRGLGLAEALGAGKRESKDLAPKKRGLNIEGLSATPDGKSLLIAFRNPHRDGKALIVPLNNPVAVLTKGSAPEFGEPIRLKLEAPPDVDSDELGIRSIEYSKRRGAYLIIAGPHEAGPGFAVYQWSGAAGEQPKLLSGITAAINRIENFTPEALIVYPKSGRLQVLSDDGTLKVKVDSPAECQPGEFKDGECEAKYLIDQRRKTFRSLWIAGDGPGPQ